MLKLVANGIIKVENAKAKVNRFFTKSSRIMKEENGAVAEYAMVLVLVLVVAIPLVVAFRDEVSNVMQTITNAIKTR